MLKLIIPFLAFVVVAGHTSEPSKFAKQMDESFGKLMRALSQEEKPTLRAEQDEWNKKLRTLEPAQQDAFFEKRTKVLQSRLAAENSAETRKPEVDRPHPFPWFVPKQDGTGLTLKLTTKSGPVEFSLGEESYQLSRKGKILQQGKTEGAGDCKSLRLLRQFKGAASGFDESFVLQLQDGPPACYGYGSVYVLGFVKGRPTLIWVDVCAPSPPKVSLLKGDIVIETKAWENPRLPDGDNRIEADRQVIHERALQPK